MHSQLPLKKLLSLIFAVLFLVGCAGASKKDGRVLAYSQDLFTPVTFIEHVGEGPMKNYLAMNVPFSPVNDLRQTTESKYGVALKTRGEAHITVISPVEYDLFFKDRFGISKINDIAREMKIQELIFEPVCIGRGALEVKTPEGVRKDETYYVVVKSQQLTELRQKIGEALQKTTGPKTAFDALKFDPHITLGFTQRDLHFEDGVVKDEKSCVWPMEPATK